MNTYTCENIGANHPIIPMHVSVRIPAEFRWITDLNFKLETRQHFLTKLLYLLNIMKENEADFTQLVIATPTWKFPAFSA